MPRYVLMAVTEGKSEGTQFCKTLIIMHASIPLGKASHTAKLRVRVKETCGMDAGSGEELDEP